MKIYEEEHLWFCASRDGEEEVRVIFWHFRTGRKLLNL